MFLDTQPAAIDPCDFAGPWRPFRIANPWQQAATLRRIRQLDLPLTLGVPGRSALRATLWTVDDTAARIVFDAASASLESVLALMQARAPWAAVYLDDAKVQFSLHALRPYDGPGDRPMLASGWPQEMVHLPRRRAVRVRRDEGYQPLVRLRHPAQPTEQAAELILPLADLSISGCALTQTDGTPALRPGDRAAHVDVALDGQTGFSADLLVRNTTLLPQGGQRVGCAWQNLGAPAQEVLQRWICGGRRRRELVSLDL